MKRESKRFGSRMKVLQTFVCIVMVILCTTFLPGCDSAIEILGDILEWLLSDPTVDLLELSEAVPAPVRGESPATTIETSQYTGTIRWRDANGASLTGNFQPSTQYNATVTLEAEPGFNFTDIEEDSFTHAGALSVRNAAGSGLITITFAPTVAPGQNTPVTLRDLTRYVTPPEKGKSPATTPINTNQYTGAIAWQVSPAHQILRLLRVPLRQAPRTGPM